MPVYTVSQVSSYLRDTLEADPLLRDMWVGGEVANLARPGSGHSYFTLRDERSSLRCVMFRNSRGAEHLQNGAAVVAHGRVSIYETRGELQLIADVVQPEGVGELQMRLEQLKLKLENEGLFEPSRKRPVPAFPQRVAVITSPSGAVWHDIQTVVSRRYPLTELALVPAPVQGDTAAAGIVDAFRAVNEEPDVDVVILARGGGSLEDLWPFNEEAVARAVYASRVPVISAVGHETDYTIADLVADIRAPTPSAGAEMVVPDQAELTSRLAVARQAIAVGVAAHLASGRGALEALRERVDRGRPDLDSARLRIDDLLGAVARYLKHNVEVKGERLSGLRLRLEALSPKDTLRRGYAVVQRREDGAVVSDVAQVERGDAVDVTLGRGAFEAEVTSADARPQSENVDAKTAVDASDSS